MTYSMTLLHPINAFSCTLNSSNENNFDKLRPYL